jgi:hypothetical protein
MGESDPMIFFYEGGGGVTEPSGIPWDAMGFQDEW